MKPTTRDAYKLFHDGALALARIESNGIRIDVGYVKKTMEDTAKTIADTERELQGTKVWTLWTKRYGPKAKLSSRDQLAQIVFGDLGFQAPGVTAKKERFRADEAAFEDVDHPFVARYIFVEKIKKARNTYLKGLIRETVDGFVHPVFNLHLATTMRSSCDTPNFQNIPERNPFAREMIRRAVIPRKGRRFIEIDYGALEFVIAACKWRDPKMIAYASDPKLDIHSDQTMECYLLSDEEVDKPTRSVGKNKCVFPLLYGSYYVSCARDLWNAVKQLNLKTKQGVPLYEHLASKGIKACGECDPQQEPLPGTLEYHIRNVERNFHKKFPVFSSAANEWWKLYQKRGWFDLMTGFRIEGYHSKNYLMNADIQGPAFHCLLQSLIWQINEIVRHKMKSLVVAQIHDCSLGDVPDAETNDYIAMVHEIMTTRIRKHWPWVICPLKAEIETTPVGGSWFEKVKGVV